MSGNIEKVYFCQLNGIPVLYSKQKSYGYHREKGAWLEMSHEWGGKGIVLEDREFFQNFGYQLPVFPDDMRRFDPRLWTMEGQLRKFSRFVRKAETPIFIDGTFQVGSAEVVPFSAIKCTPKRKNRKISATVQEA